MTEMVIAIAMEISWLRRSKIIFGLTLGAGLTRNGEQRNLDNFGSNARAGQKRDGERLISLSGRWRREIFGRLPFFVGLNLGRSLVAVCAGFSLGLPCAAEAASLSGWVTDWDSQESLAAVRGQVSGFDTLWLFSANASHLVELEDSKKDKEGKQDRWRLTEPLREIDRLARQAGVRVGPVIHNSGVKGFDSALGERLISNPKEVAKRLKSELKKNKWRALSIDLESLPAKSAPQFEEFLKQIEKTFRGMDISVSVCLHAQDGTKDVDISRFQNWKRLAKIPLDFVVMGYDHSWETSAPGPVSPQNWLNEVWQYAQKEFGASRVILALPAYGYHWKKEESGWRGKAEDVAALSAKVSKDSGWRKEAAVKSEDGQLFWLKKDGNADQAIAFDDDSSVSAKLAHLEKLEGGGPKRVAVWRLANLTTSFLEKMTAKPSN